MAKIRLNQKHRDFLNDKAGELIEVNLDKRRDLLFKRKQKTQKKIIKSMGKFLPPDEMKVLTKWDAVKSVSQIKICFEADVSCFSFVGDTRDSEDFYHQVPDVGWQGIAPMPVPQGLLEEVKDQISEEQQISSDRQDAIIRYGSLIRSCKNFEDLVSIWPEGEAEQWRTEIESFSTTAALVAVTSETLRVIQEEAAERKRLKKK